MRANDKNPLEDDLVAQHSPEHIKINQEFFRRFMNFPRLMWYAAKAGLGPVMKTGNVFAATDDEELKRYSLQQVFEKTARHANDPSIQKGRVIIQRYLAGERFFGSDEKNFVDFVIDRITSEDPNKAPIVIAEDVKTTIDAVRNWVRSRLSKSRKK